MKSNVRVSSNTRPKAQYMGVRQQRERWVAHKRQEITKPIANA